MSQEEQKPEESFISHLVELRGRVLEVPIEEGNRLVHKGDVLFRVDPTPYQLDVANLEAQLALAQGGDPGDLSTLETGPAPTTEEA